MQAKKVYEALNFKRGEDPHQAIGLGINRPPEAFDNTKEFVRHGVEQIAKHIPGFLYDPNWIRFEDDARYVYELYTNVAGEIIYVPNLGYYDDYGWVFHRDIDDPNPIQNIHISEFIDNLKKEHNLIDPHFTRELKRRLGLTESIDFKRGEEPQQALGVGDDRSEESFDSPWDYVKWSMEKLNKDIPQFNFNYNWIQYNKLRKVYEINRIGLVGGFEIFYMPKSEGKDWGWYLSELNDPNVPIPIRADKTINKFRDSLLKLMEDRIIFTLQLLD